MFHCRDVSLSDILSMAIQLVNLKTLRYISHCVTQQSLICILNVSFYHCYASLVYITNAFSFQFFIQNSMENIFCIKINCLRFHQCSQLKRPVDLYYRQEFSSVLVLTLSPYPTCNYHISIRWFWAQMPKIFSYCNLNGYVYKYYCDGRNLHRQTEKK